MSKFFYKIGLTKTTVKYAWFCFFALILFAATFFKQVVWAEDVDISAYSGWCLGNITGVGGGYTYVDIRQDTGIGCPTTGTYSGTVKFNNCEFQYNCGLCSGGSKTCTYTGSYIPSPYACATTPATTKTEPCTATPPTITDVSTPTAGAMIMAAYQPITFSYQDNVKVVSVEIYDGTTLLTTMTINETSGSRYYNWYTSTVAEGPHTIKLIAYDDESTPSAAFTRDVIIDFNPPTIVLTSPSASGANIVGPFTISASASDTGSGVKEVKFFLDGMANTNQLGPTMTVAPFSYNWDSNTVANGGHKIYVHAADKAGRTNYTYFDFTVNNTAVVLPVGPTVVFTSPVAATGAAVANVDNTTNLSVNVTAGTSPVANVKFFLDSTTNQLGPTFTATPYSYDWDTKDTANGNHSIYAVATDTAGLSTSVHIYVNVQNTTASSGGGGSSTVTCTYTCSEWGVCTAEEKQSCLNFTHTPTTGTCSEPAPTSKTQNCTYVPEVTTGTIIVKNKVVNDGGGTKKVSDFSFTVNGGNQISFNSGGENDLKKAAGVYTIRVPAVENYVTTYDKCSNIDLVVGQTVTCTVTNTYKAPTVAQVKCAYSCNKWSECSMANIKTCIDIVKTPPGCLDWVTTAPAADCQYQAPAQECIFTCLKWGDCTAEGKMLCSSYSHTPAGANCSNKEPSEPKACEYVAPVAVTDTAKTEATNGTEDVAAATDADIKKSNQKRNAVKCEYTYSAYGVCVDNKRTRIVLSKAPDNCQEEANPPVLEEDCDSSVAEPVVRPEDAPVPVPEAVTAVGVARAQENQQLNNYNGRTGGDWQKYYFGSEICTEASVCGGDADPDNDGLINNEEYRFGTDPKAADTDGDGRVDGGEILTRRDPLAVSGMDTGDQMVFEDPKASSAGNEGLYEVTNVETVGGERGAKIVKLSGKAMPNTYINLVVFSEPIVMTVKTNEDGSWSYVLDRPLPEGNHEVYVVATSNTGKIVAKSDSFGFAQTAEAAVATPAPGATVDRAPAPTKTRAGEGYLLLGLFSFLGLSLAVVAIGLVRGKPKNDQPLQ